MNHDRMHTGNVGTLANASSSSSCVSFVRRICVAVSNSTGSLYLVAENRFMGIKICYRMQGVF